MNDEFEFKDKEISKVTDAINKEAKHEFGQAFKEAVQKNAGDLETHTASIETTAQTTPAQTMPVTPTAPAGSGTTPAETPQQDDVKKVTYDPILKTLQTYERDIAEAIRNKDASVASINVAKQKKEIEKEQRRAAAPQEVATEEKKAERKERTQKVTRGGLMVLVSTVLVIGGVALFGSIYYFASTRPEPVVQVTPSLIAVDRTTTTDITGLTGNDLVQEILRTKTNVSPQTVTRLQVFEGVAEAKKEITPGRFFDLVAPASPATLRRAFGGSWLLGLFGQGSSATPFVLATVDSFENAFDGMLRWEPTIANDLGQMILSTEQLSAVSGRTFEDKIIRNKDVRILRDIAGNTTLLYSFLDRKHVLIATNEEVFTEILNRFLSSRIVR